MRQDPFAFGMVGPLRQLTFDVELPRFAQGSSIRLSTRYETSLIIERPRYVAIFRLRQCNASPSQYPLAFDELAYYRSGDSDCVPDAAGLDFDVISEDDGAIERLILTSHTNAHGRLSALEFEFDADTIEEAGAFAAKTFIKVKTAIAAANQVPLFREHYIIMDCSTREALVVLAVPYQPTIIDRHYFFDEAMALVLETFDEGLTANSQSYAFLSFYKVVEFLTTKGFPRLRIIARNHNVNWIEEPKTLPDVPTRYLMSDLVGVKLSKVRERFYKEYRIAIAHFTSSLRLNDRFAELSVSMAALVLRFACVDLIAVLGRNVSNLRSAGVSGLEIQAALYDPSTPGR
jgi:hypothetical protein